MGPASSGLHPTTICRRLFFAGDGGHITRDWRDFLCGASVLVIRSHKDFFFFFPLKVYMRREGDADR